MDDSKGKCVQTAFFLSLEYVIDAVAEFYNCAMRYFCVRCLRFCVSILHFVACVFVFSVLHFILLLLVCVCKLFSFWVCDKIHMNLIFIFFFCFVVCIQLERSGLVVNECLTLMRTMLLNNIKTSTSSDNRTRIHIAHFVVKFRFDIDRWLKLLHCSRQSMWNLQCNTLHTNNIRTGAIQSNTKSIQNNLNRMYWWILMY